MHPPKTPVSRGLLGNLGCVSIALIPFVAGPLFLGLVAGIPGDPGDAFAIAFFVVVFVGAGMLAAGAVLLFVDGVRHRRELAAMRQFQQAEAERRERERLQAEAAAHRAREEAKRQKWDALVATFGERDARAIWDRRLWVGAPEAAAVAMFGNPDDVDEKVLKTKTKRILKYRDRHHAGRYERKITVENGAVVGWES